MTSGITGNGPVRIPRRATQIPMGLVALVAAQQQTPGKSYLPAPGSSFDREPKIEQCLSPAYWLASTAW
jgi:hypothetical protein